MTGSTDSLARVAHALREEMFYQRHGFMPVPSLSPPDPAMLHLAAAAISALDDNTAGLEQRRQRREQSAAMLLGTNGMPTSD